MTTSAYFNGDPLRTAPDHASGYSPQADGWRLVPEGSGYSGNAGMMASVQDLLQERSRGVRFDRMKAG